MATYTKAVYCPLCEAIMAIVSQTTIFTPNKLTETSTAIKCDNHPDTELEVLD